MDQPLLVVKNLKKYFPITRGILSRTIGCVHAVDGISLSVGRGRTLGLVGESGCGKTSAGKVMLKLLEPTSGGVWYNGTDISGFSKRQMKTFRQEMQFIFQDPYSSLNPRMTIGEIVGAPLEIHNLTERKKRGEVVGDLLAKVGLSSKCMHRYPHEFSGGQRQRIGIARALATNPKLIIADEPVSALDVSIQAQIINLLLDLQTKLHLTYVIISHDLGVVSHMSDDVAVMYLGKIVEIGPRQDIYFGCLHPYTRALLSSLPKLDLEPKTKRILLGGDVPSPINPPKGCRFHPRCLHRIEPCDSIEPELKEIKGGHFVACHLQGVSDKQSS